MNDLISRQDTIDALERIFNRCEEIETHLPDGAPDKTGYKMFPDYMTVWKYLRQLPSAPQWIPCSEKSPEEDGRYLCTYSDFGICVDFGLYTDGHWIIEPIAWMPLPQPWKGE